VSNPLPVEAIAVRLADEGVPLRAIARATNTPSDQIREQLHAAKDTGQLVDLPKEDWPPGFPRDQRALQLSRMVVEDKEAVTLSLQQIFRLTATEVSLLMMLLQNPSVPKVRINMVHRTIDVHICNIRRRLNPFHISIDTIWGYGYQFTADARRRVMELILAHVAAGEPHA
jgi:DNA-binding response OmpR family regulator